jgi:hypothetical protein
VTLVSNAAVVSVIFSYIHLVEKNTAITVLGLTIVPRESFLLLGLAVAVMIIVSLLFATSQYYARSNAISAMGRFEKQCTVRAMELFQLLPDARADAAQRLLRSKKLLHLVKTDATHCGMAVKFIGFGLQSLLMLIFAILVMFALDARTTTIVCALGLIIIAAQYPSNLFAATAAADHNRTRPAMQARLTALLDRAARQPRWSSNTRLERDITEFFHKAAPNQHIAAAENKFRAIEVSGLTTRVGSALILGGMVMSFGSSVIRGEVNWAALTAYLALLRSALTSITAVFQTVTMVTRMYPQIQEFAEFVLSASQAESTLPTTGRTARIGYTVRGFNELGERAHVTAPPGAVVGFMVAPGYGRDAAIDLQWALRVHHQDEESDDFVTVDLAVPPPATSDPQCIDKWLDDLRCGDRLEEALSRLADSAADVILIDRKAFEVMPPARWMYWRQLFRDRLIVVVYTDPDDAFGQCGESLLIFYQEPGELAWRPKPSQGWSSQSLEDLLTGGRRVGRPESEGGEDLLE